MRLLRFIFSRVFLIQLILAVLVVLVVCLLLLKWLNFSTNHNQFVQVPKVTNMLYDQAKQKLMQATLNIEILDTANFNPKYPPFAVIDQTPIAGKNVKEGRRIYLTINPSGHRKVSVPNIIQYTQRTAEAALRAVGFKVGTTEYEDNIGKNMVLKLKQNDKEIQPGDMLLKTSVIDLVLGNGKEKLTQ